MKFEDKFPSLKQEECYDIIDEVYDKDTLIKHCLDKQKVKEAIDKVFKNSYAETSEGRCLPDELKKELGLK